MNEKEFLLKLGKKMKALRKEKNIPMRDLAKRIDIHWTTYGQWEMGRRYPRLDHLIRFCEVFGIRIEEIWK